MNSLFKRKAVAILTITAIGMQNVAVLSANVVGEVSTIKEVPFTYEANITTSSQITVETTTSSAIQVEDVDNLLQNGNFEAVEVATAPWISDEKPQGWEVASFNNGKLPQFELIQKNQNDKAVRMNIQEEGTRASLGHGKIAVKADSKYELSVEADVNIVGGGNFGVQVKSYGNGGKYLGEQRYLQATNSNGWKTLTQDITLPVGTETVEIYILAGSSATAKSGTIVVDNIVFKEIKQPVNIPVTAIILSQTKIQDKVGTSHQLLATIEPQNATNKNLEWSSTNEAVAKVDANGQVILVGEGSAEIIATTIDGTISTKCVVASEQADITNKNGDNSE